MENLDLIMYQLSRDKILLHLNGQPKSNLYF
jgi:hypothetical protein